MPSISGTSERGGQFVYGYDSISQPMFEILTQSLVELRPTRLGYAFVIARENSDFTRKRVLQHGPIYSPGTFVMFPSTYGFDGFQYGWYIDWNIAGLAYEIYYE